MPFALSNASASFQGYIHKILAKKLDIFIIIYLDDILIYIDDPGQGYVGAVWWMLDILRKHGLFGNLKRCQFHNDEICFLSYVISAQGVRIEDEQIEAVKTWPEPNSVQNIQVFIGFANFYRHFMQSFSRIAALLPSILKTTRSSDSAIKAFRADDNEVVRVGGRADETFKNLSKSKKAKKDKFKSSTRVRAMGKPTFLNTSAREAFDLLRQAFTKAPIL